METQKKIVVVDDEYFISKSLSFIFEKEGKFFYYCGLNLQEIKGEV